MKKKQYLVNGQWTEEESSDVDGCVEFEAEGLWHWWAKGGPSRLAPSEAQAKYEVEASVRSR